MISVDAKIRDASGVRQFIKDNATRSKLGAAGLAANDPDRLKSLEENLVYLNKLKLASLQKQEEIISNSSFANKKELINNFNTSKSKYTIKIAEIKNLGPLGYKLEEMRLSIEKRYESMLQDLNQKLESIKKYFNNLINEVKGEAFNSIINEKDHNLSNIKEYLEDKLVKIKEKKDAGSTDDSEFLKVETSFLDFFDFFENFKEDCLNFITYKISNINIDSLKKELNDVKSKNLDSLLSAPRAFTSELFRYFEVDRKQFEDHKSEAQSISFGDVFQIERGTVDNALFEKASNSFDPELNSKCKTPMVHILNHQYLVVATRERFRISSYTYASNQHNIPKSRFYQNVFMEKGEKLNMKDVYCSADLETNSLEGQVSFHSICSAKYSDDSYYIFLGGNNCVSCR